jgi:hypothetical protein
MATRAPALIIARGRGQVTVINQIGSVPRSCWAAVPSILDDVLPSAVAMTSGDSELLRQFARDTRDRTAKQCLKIVCAKAHGSGANADADGDLANRLGQTRSGSAASQPSAR